MNLAMHNANRFQKPCNSVAEMLGLIDLSIEHAWSNQCVNHPNTTLPADSHTRKRKQILQELPNADMVVLGAPASESCSTAATQSNVSSGDKLECDRLNKMLRQERMIQMMVLQRRRDAILEKVRSQKQNIKFSRVEEMDIIQRFNEFVDQVAPDEKYCIMPAEIAKPVDGDRRFGSSISGLHLSIPRPHANHCYVINTKTYALEKEYGTLPRLPLGTKLLKPGGKLVELVALAIDQSPDGVLQAQQVYTFLIKKYPYFAFMDKFSSTSWRSSIRHALYQKWFKKITLCDDKLNNKGCFWALNPQVTSREWAMPSPFMCAKDSCPCIRCASDSMFYEDPVNNLSTSQQVSESPCYKPPARLATALKPRNQNIPVCGVGRQTLLRQTCHPNSELYCYGDAKAMVPYGYTAPNRQPSALNATDMYNNVGCYQFL